MSNDKFNNILASFGKATEANTAPVAKEETKPAPKEEPAKEAPKSNKLADKESKEEILAAMKKVEENMKPMGIDPETIPAYQEMQKKLDVILDEEAKQRAAEAKAKAEAEAKEKAEAEAKAKAEAEAKARAEAETPDPKANEIAPVKTEANKVTTGEKTLGVPGGLAPVKDKKTSLRKGFVLLINANSNSYTNTANLATIYAEVAEKVKANNSELNAQQVHATVVASAPQIAEKMLKGLCVTGVVMDTFVIELATALVPHADIVVYGTQPN